MANGPGGKVGERKHMAQFSPFLAHLAATAPEQPSPPPVSAPAVSASAAQPASRTELGFIALFSWLITVGRALPARGGAAR